MTNGKEITLAQANALTQARYDFTVVEKRAVYQIIREVRHKFIERPDGQRDLFNDLIISMKTSDLQASDTPLRDVYKSLKSLRRKSIWIEDEERVLEVGYINYFEHKKREPVLEVQVSHKILPYLVELAEQFTTYSLTVAIALRTKYSQRFYEYCAQFRAVGFFYVPYLELREKLMLGDTYPRYSLFRAKVLETARKELKALYDKGQCDLHFNYSEDRAGRTVLGLKIAVVDRKSEELKNAELKPEDCMFYIKNWLRSWLLVEKRPKNKAWLEGVVNYLNRNPEKIQKLYKRLEKMQKTEKPASYAALARHIIEEDFLE